MVYMSALSSSSYREEIALREPSRERRREENKNKTETFRRRDGEEERRGSRGTKETEVRVVGGHR